METLNTLSTDANEFKIIADKKDEPKYEAKCLSL